MVPSSTRCNKRSCLSVKSNPSNTKTTPRVPPAIVSLVIIFTASAASNDFAFLPAPGGVCVCYLGQLGAVAASPPTLHLSFLFSSSRCLAAVPVGRGGAAGHMGLFPVSHRGGSGAISAPSGSIPIIELSHLCTKGPVVLGSIPFTPCLFHATIERKAERHYQAMTNNPFPVQNPISEWLHFLGSSSSKQEALPWRRQQSVGGIKKGFHGS